MTRIAILMAAAVVSTAHARGSRGDGGSVRDHRSDSSSSTVRDHRGSDSSSSTVRDHRSSSSDSSDSASSSTYVASSTSESAPPCIDETDVVGFRHCRKFGTWAGNMRMPSWFLDLGSNVRQLDSGFGRRTGAVTSSLRIGFNVPRKAYLGTELELGGIVSPALLDMTAVDEQRGIFLGALGIVGVRASSRFVTFAIEGAGGVRSARYHFTSTNLGMDETSTLVDTRGVVEARARAELWLNPWVSFDAALGTNVLERGEWLAGLYLGLHSRAFAGSR